jgi:iron complex outermembrane receptor protein
VPPSLAALNGLVGGFSGGRVDYRAALQYRFNDDVMGYAQFSTGFRGGGINPRPFFPAQACRTAPKRSMPTKWA